MAVFYSFHYELDHWRVQQVRNMGTVGNAGSVAAQEWESVRYRSRYRIQRWIDEQMNYKRAVVVLIGSQTSQRYWVQYEIARAWEKRKPLLGIRIDGLKDQNGYVAERGKDPFQNLGVTGIPVFEPQGQCSSEIYLDIRANLPSWIKQGYVRA